MRRTRRKLVPTFATHYVTVSGTLMVISDLYVVLVRIADRFCERFTYAQLGFKETDDGEEAEKAKGI